MLLPRFLSRERTRLSWLDPVFHSGLLAKMFLRIVTFLAFDVADEGLLGDHKVLD